MRNSIPKRIAAVLIFLAASACTAQVAAQNTPSAQNAWNAPTRITVATRSPEIATAEVLTFALGASGDTLISETYPQQTSVPERQLLVAGGRWLAMKDVAVQPGYEIDALDGPMLTMQLVVRFLERALPEGPDSVRGRQAIDVSEPFKPIRVNTVSAEGGWEAPWNLRGFVERKSARQIAYDFVVFHSERGETAVHSIEFSGTWESGTATDAFADSKSLRGWKIYKLGPSTRKSANGNGVDFGAEEQHIYFDTLGDLRGKAVQASTIEKPVRKPSIPSSLSSPLQRY